MVLGQANALPVIMTLSKSTGQISQFLTIEPVATQTSTPTYGTFQAVYSAEMESDGQSYIYVSFTMSGANSPAQNYDMHMLRIQTSGTLAIVWDMVYRASSSNVNIPMLLFNDMTDPNVMYFAG